MRFLSILSLVFISHGVDVEVIPSKAIVIKAQYSDGTSMAGAFITLTSPDGEKREGELDGAGEFVFIPDMEGEWKIEIDDGLGHGKVLTVNVEEGTVKQSEIIKRSSQFQDIITGLGVIIGITGIVFYIVTRMKYAHS